MSLPVIVTGECYVKEYIEIYDGFRQESSDLKFLLS
jgi:hypothetical protein